MKNNSLRLGSFILAIGYGALFMASWAIVSTEASPLTVVGRHLWAGSLANVTLCLVEILIIFFSLRKGEKWAWWAVAAPIPGYGIPILCLDAFYVTPEHLWVTLSPQIFGLLLAGAGLWLTRRVLFTTSKNI